MGQTWSLICKSNDGCLLSEKGFGSPWQLTRPRALVFYGACPAEACMRALSCRGHLSVAAAVALVSACYGGHTAVRTGLHKRWCAQGLQIQVLERVSEAACPPGQSVCTRRHSQPASEASGRLHDRTGSYMLECTHARALPLWVRAHGVHWACAIPCQPVPGWMNQTKREGASQRSVSALAVQRRGDPIGLESRLKLDSPVPKAAAGSANMRAAPGTSLFGRLPRVQCGASRSELI